MTDQIPPPSAAGAEGGAEGPSQRPFPRWAWIAAAVLVAAALAVLAIGRGGTAVLLGAVLAFCALAVLLLSVPDGDPSRE